MLDLTPISWLNWVVRLRGGGLIGYVQATIYPKHRAGIAYEFASRFWGQGLAGEAARAMIAELEERYRVKRFSAVLKRTNQRSRGLLQRLGFVAGAEDLYRRYRVGADELLMLHVLTQKRLRRKGNAAAMTSSGATMSGSRKP